MYWLHARARCLQSACSRGPLSLLQNVLLSSVAGFGWGRVEAQASEMLPSAQSSMSGAGVCSTIAGGAVDPGAPAVAESDAQLLRPLAGLWRPPVTAKVSDFGLR